MDNLQIQEYIRNAIASGYSIEKIRQDLLSAGWQQSVIEPYLINIASSTSQIIQPSSTTNPTIPNTATHSNTQTIAEPSKPKISTLTKIALGLLGLGAIFIVTFIILTTIGKSVYISPKTNFTQNDIQNEQNINLTIADNPYRIFLYARYIVKGKPFDLRNKLFDYNISITDDQDSQIATTNGSYTYHDSSSSSESKTNLSIENSHIILPLKVFQIEKNGNYKILAKLAVPQSLDSNFTLSDWNYEIKGKVLTPTPYLLISGFILFFVSFILFVIDRKKKASV